MSIAQVIIDIPSRQTDHVFDYTIPERLDTLIQPGMRVTIPFGTRTVSGFVQRIIDDSDYEGSLKDIIEILDDEPVLNKELLTLASDLTEKLFCFLIDAYKTMLPRMLKTTTKKYFVPTPQLTYINQQLYFKKDNEIDWQTAEKNGNLIELIALKANKEVTIDYRIEDKKQYKTELWIQPLVDRKESEQLLKQLKKNAKKQIRLLELLSELDGKKITKQSLQDHDIHLPTLRIAEKKGWIRLFSHRIERDPYADVSFETTVEQSLLPEQRSAYNQIKEKMDQREAETFLLQGVTGSGKTEVYLQLIHHALKNKQSAILLVPEISLTPQMVRQLKGRFGKDVAVLHSQLSKGEQFDEWLKMKEGRAKVVVGARSSIFAPLDHLGIIIIDEEHESTYKQNNTPRYHAREVAKWRSAYHHCPLVLGSATPSLESRARAQNNVYTLIEMKKRINQHPLPEVTVVDMREEYKFKNYYQFSRQLKEAMEQTLRRGEQVALMLNRRGYANYLMCRDCGYVFMCENCDVSLTYHYHTHTLQCHYCGYTTHYPQRCLKCQQQHLRSFGTGTERIEQELNELFATHTVVRMDRDTTRKKGAYERLLNKIETGEANILLGTQMIAKGLDFPNITLVGVINADTSLYLPDYRASERTFQLLTQVSGRAGRGDKVGKVFIQTFNPDHYAIEYAKTHDYNAFYQTEMPLRKKSHYSPYYYSLSISISHFDEKEALKGAMEVRRQLNVGNDNKEMEIMGPSRGAVARIKNRYYFQILCQYRRREAIQSIMTNMKEELQEWEKKHLYVTIDIEPQVFI